MSIYSNITVNSDYDMQPDGNENFNLFFIDASSNNVEITLTYRYPYDGVYYTFLRLDSSINVVTLTATGSGVTIDGASSITLGAKQYCEIILNGTDWRIIRV